MGFQIKIKKSDRKKIRGLSLWQKGLKMNILGIIQSWLNQNLKLQIIQTFLFRKESQEYVELVPC
jgi:hypothetical protein